MPMPRVLRLLFPTVAASSLITCAAAGALWVLSETSPQMDFFTVIKPDSSYGLGTERGGIIGFLQRSDPYVPENRADTVVAFGGFRYIGSYSTDLRRWNLVLPFWFLMLVFSLAPAWWWLRRRKVRRRRRLGLCQRCGYDLRATPERCPECGTTPAIA